MDFFTYNAIKHKRTNKYPYSSYYEHTFEPLYGYLKNTHDICDTPEDKYLNPIYSDYLNSPTIITYNINIDMQSLREYILSLLDEKNIELADQAEIDE